LFDLSPIEVERILAISQMDFPLSWFVWLPGMWSGLHQNPR
jgi:hypothetical protein